MTFKKKKKVKLLFW